MPQATRTYSQADFDEFARLSGDDNPIHVDPEFAARTRFGRTLAHGMMLFSTLSGLIQRRSPGARLLDVDLTFPGPTYVGDEMSIELSFEPLEGSRARVIASVIAPDGTPACLAQATVEVRS